MEFQDFYVRDYYVRDYYVRDFNVCEKFVAPQFSSSPIFDPLKFNNQIREETQLYFSPLSYQGIFFKDL